MTIFCSSKHTNFIVTRWHMAVVRVQRFQMSKAYMVNKMHTIIMKEVKLDYSNKDSRFPIIIFQSFVYI